MEIHKDNRCAGWLRSRAPLMFVSADYWRGGARISNVSTIISGHVALNGISVFPDSLCAFSLDIQAGAFAYVFSAVSAAPSHMTIRCHSVRSDLSAPDALV